jgi:hypothetical protein
VDEESWPDDIRDVLAEVLAQPVPDPDFARWRAFVAAFGCGPDPLPEYLRQLGDPDPDVVGAALGVLWEMVRHQGGSTAGAAYAVPFLIRAAADPKGSHRASLLLLAAEAGRRNHFGVDRRADLLVAHHPPDEPTIDQLGCPVDATLEAAGAAVAACAPLLIGFLGDRAPEVRVNAAYALATACPAPPTVRAALRERFGAERDPVVRIGLILAETQVAVAHDDAAGAQAWTGALWRDPAVPPEVRLGAALAWLCATSLPPPESLLDVLVSAVGPAVERWLSGLPWPDDIAGHGGPAAWLIAFVDDPGTGMRLAQRLVAARAPSVGRPASVVAPDAGVVAPDPAVVASACRGVYDLAVEWRGDHADAAVALLVERLSDEDPAVRVRAARYLARTGTAATRWADRVAATLPDAETHPWAVLTLAHCGDPRVVPALAGILTGDVCPWPSRSAWQDPTPPPARLLDRLQPHADALMPAILHRLGADEDGWSAVRRDLIAGLDAWGPAAAGAVDALTALLSGPGGPDLRLAMALGRIGAAAQGAVPVLDGLIADAGAESVATLLWVRWRITGERAAETASALAGLATVAPHGPGSLRLLADLGPEAAAHEAVIRERLREGWYWERAEAAHALWRATGETAETVPVLLWMLRLHAQPWIFGPVHVAAAGYLGAIGPAAGEASGALTAFLAALRRAGRGTDRHDEISWDEHCRDTATAALARIRPGDRIRSG